MSQVALLVAAAVLVPLVSGVGAGAIINSQGPWRDTFEVAAAGAGVVVVAVLVAIFVGLALHPSECTQAGCNDTDNAAAVQVLFVVPLLVPIYALALPGAAIGKLLGRGVRRVVDRSPGGRGLRDE